MQNINRVLITGNLTRDPELKTFGDTTVCNMRIASNARTKQQGEWVDKANYFDVVVFGKTAENCNQYLAKGRPIAVDGRLDWREWKANDESRRQAVQIIADTVQFLDSGGERNSSGGGETTGGAFTAVPVSADDDIPF